MTNEEDANNMALNSEKCEWVGEGDDRNRAVLQEHDKDEIGGFILSLNSVTAQQIFGPYKTIPQFK